MEVFKAVIGCFALTGLGLLLLLAIISLLSTLRGDLEEIWWDITEGRERKKAVKELVEREKRAEAIECERRKECAAKAPEPAPPPEPELLPCYYLTAKDADGGPQVIKVWTSACDVVKRYTTHFFGPYRMAEGVDAALLRHRTTGEYIHIPYTQRNDAERLTREQARQLMYKRLSTEEYEKLFPVITYTEDTPALLDGWAKAGENKGKEDA